MKILALSDIHSDLERVKKLRAKIKELKPDIITISGDLGTMGETQKAQEELTAEILDTLYSGEKILAVTGNHDGEGVSGELKRKGATLHENAVNVDGIGFVGFGGPKTERLGGLYIMNYDPLDEKLKDLRECKKRIIVSHPPPRNTKLDKALIGINAGSDFIKDVIYDEQPDLVLCGHVHEGKGVEKLGKTTVVNTGALCEGYAALIDVDEGNPKVEFLFLDE